jgi:hypothetical protein
MLNDKYLSLIESTIGQQAASNGQPLKIRGAINKYLMDPTNATNNEELFHIEHLFNSQKVFYSKIQLAMHAQTTMHAIRNPSE